MRYAVVGAGAIGAYVGASLARGGAEVVLIARGEQLRAFRAGGVVVQSARGDFAVAPGCTDTCADVGPVDVVILALKAHQIAGMLGQIRHLLRDDTTIVSMQNGIPWWYFQRHGGPLDGLSLQAVDPGGTLAAAFDPDRVVGCAVYCSTEMARPGVVRHIEGTRFSLGLPGGGTSRRLERIARDLIAGELKAPLLETIRDEVWTKLLGNVCFNPLSALTRATLSELATDEHAAPVVRTMMEETLAVARRLGVEVPVSIDKRIDGARRVGEHKTSTLQDIEAGRPLEVDCIVGAVVELGELLGVDVTASAQVYRLTKLLDRAVQRRVTRGETMPAAARQPLQAAVG
ncbi:MAG TPA: 2-dehydropantoate 2-reductase [Candidatus Limnocylindria bacterium]|jgi:2-dehydropantoate 2-reductase|nr:2-dehydropantoate 2-reductase [Candidatus Limnocylindria bacterium]